MTWTQPHPVRRLVLVVIVLSGLLAASMLVVFAAYVLFVSATPEGAQPLAQQLMTWRRFSRRSRAIPNQVY